MRPEGIELRTWKPDEDILNVRTRQSELIGGELDWLNLGGASELAPEM